ncbi:unannotated protein [freshwater metagenome]|uniref:Unannotated protein n=1 Tax=freshwater metagenome TaxID=449393 RepID=A0A6J7ILS3_9ZZZZ
MRKRVAIVQDRSTPTLAFVARDHLGFDLDAPSHACVEVERTQIIAGQEVVLRHLARSASVFTWRQRGEGLGVAEHRRRLPERAYQILALGQVDAGLAADGRVDHAEQCGGYRHVPDAAVIGRRGEPCDVGDHATAHGDDAVVPGETPLRERPAQRLDSRERLGWLAIADGEHARLATRGDLVGDGILRDDGCTPHARREYRREVMPHTAADAHFIGARPEGNGDRPCGHLSTSSQVAAFSGNGSGPATSAARPVVMASNDMRSTSTM